MLKTIARKLGFHPRAIRDSLFTYPRFLGRIKPALLQSSEVEWRARLQALQSCLEPSLLKVPLAKRMLVVSPHPDDESIGCGGLLLAHRGISEVHVVTVFNGEGGGRLPDSPWQDTPDYKARLVSVRKQELAAAGRMLGLASVQALDVPDGCDVPSARDIQNLRRIVDEIKPEIVLIPWFMDNLPDHRTANRLYALACTDFPSLVLSFEVWSLCTVNSIFELGPALLEEKLRLVRLYRSQQSTVDYARYVEALAQTRGFLHGVGPRRASPAETFFALPGPDYCELVLSYSGLARPSSALPADLRKTA